MSDKTVPAHYECVPHRRAMPCLDCYFAGRDLAIKPRYRPRKPQESPPNGYDISGGQER